MNSQSINEFRVVATGVSIIVLLCLGLINRLVVATAAAADAFTKSVTPILQACCRGLISFCDESVLGWHQR